MVTPSLFSRTNFRPTCLLNAMSLRNSLSFSKVIGLGLLPANPTLAATHEVHQVGRFRSRNLGFDARAGLGQVQAGPVQDLVGLLARRHVRRLVAAPLPAHHVDP